MQLKHTIAEKVLEEVIEEEGGKGDQQCST